MWPSRLRPVPYLEGKHGLAHGVKVDGVQVYVKRGGVAPRVVVGEEQLDTAVGHQSQFDEGHGFRICVSRRESVHD